MIIASGLIQLQTVPRELIEWINNGFDLRGNTVKEFSPICLLSVQKNLRLETLRYFLSHPEKINDEYPSIVTNTSRPIVLRTSLGLYLFDGAHRGNAALSLNRKLLSIYKDLTK